MKQEHRVRLILEVDGRKISRELVCVDRQMPKTSSDDPGAFAVLETSDGKGYCNIQRHEYDPQNGAPIVDLSGFDKEAAGLLNRIFEGAKQ